MFIKNHPVFILKILVTSLSHTTSTIIVYVPLNTIDDEMSNLEQYVQYIDQTCARMIVRNWTACRHFGDIMTQTPTDRNH